MPNSQHSTGPSLPLHKGLLNLLAPRQEGKQLGPQVSPGPLCLPRVSGPPRSSAQWPPVLCLRARRWSDRASGTGDHMSVPRAGGVR